MSRKASSDGDIKLPDRRAEPVYLRLAEELEGSILSGAYRPGDRLPTEHSLAEGHGVNRHTARQALNHLQAKGLVSRVRSRGNFVRPDRIDYRVAAKMSFSDSVSRAGLEPSTKVLHVRKVRAYGRLAEEFSVPIGEPLVALERVSFAGEIPLDYGARHYREELFPGLYELLLGRWRSVRALIRDYYAVEVYRAHSTFELEPADTGLSRHLGVPTGSALLAVTSLDTLEDGTPAEWGVTYFRGDVTRVRVSLREDVVGRGEHPAADPHPR